MSGQKRPHSPEGNSSRKKQSIDIDEDNPNFKNMLQFRKNILSTQEETASMQTTIDSVKLMIEATVRRLLLEEEYDQKRIQWELYSLKEKVSEYKFKINEVCENVAKEIDELLENSDGIEFRNKISSINKKLNQVVEDLAPVIQDQNRLIMKINVSLQFYENNAFLREQYIELLNTYKHESNVAAIKLNKWLELCKDVLNDRFVSNGHSNIF